jgi:hypothetical protein
MRRATPLLGLILLLAFSSRGAEPARLSGVFVSKDEPGILVFRSDGVFGYKIPTKHTFYAEDNLPPNRGRYRMRDDGSLQLLDTPEDLDMALHVEDNGRTVILRRTKSKVSGLPARATYHKQPPRG